MKILAFDPGGTTGVAWHDTETKEWKRWELEGEHHLALDLVLCTEPKQVLIYEEFTYQRRAVDKGVSLSLISKEYIGVIKLWYQIQCIEGPIPLKLVPQMPAAMTFWTNEKLAKVKLDMPGSEHMRDATRHILYYLMTVLKDDTYIQMLR